jgi:DNA-3-methyladenine glycosylase II
MADHPFVATARAAEAHLVEVDPRFATLVEGIGPCTLIPEGDLFRGLVRAVLAQLISAAAAKSITAKVEAALKGRVTPTALGKLTDEQLQACGVSTGKRKTLRGIVELFSASKTVGKKLLAADDDTLRATLTALHGVGPWTVDMVQIFCLGRPDIWPVGDLGVRLAVKDVFKLRKLPDAKRMHALAKPWQPYRTVAAWYLWRSRSLVPQST